MSDVKLRECAVLEWWKGDRRFSLAVTCATCPNRKPSKVDSELADLRAMASRAMSDYETAVQELAKVKAERDEALRKQAIDERQCNDMTDQAARLATELAKVKAERVDLLATCEDYRIQACRPDDCNVKKRLEAMTARAEKAEAFEPLAKASEEARQKAEAKLKVAVEALTLHGYFGVVLAKIDAIERGEAT